MIIKKICVAIEDNAIPKKGRIAIIIDTNKLIKNMWETSASFSNYKHDKDQDVYYIH